MAICLGATLRERKAIDILVQVPVKASEIETQRSIHTILVHVENQATSKVKFNQRMFFYFAELHREYRLPVYLIALSSQFAQTLPKYEHHQGQWFIDRCRKYLDKSWRTYGLTKVKT